MNLNEKREIIMIEKLSQMNLLVQYIAKSKYLIQNAKSITMNC
jgi:hypothetical protein